MDSVLDIFPTSLIREITVGDAKVIQLYKYNPTLFLLMHWYPEIQIAHWKLSSISYHEGTNHVQVRPRIAGKHENSKNIKTYSH